MSAPHAIVRARAERQSVSQSLAWEEERESNIIKPTVQMRNHTKKDVAGEDRRAHVFLMETQLRVGYPTKIITGVDIFGWLCCTLSLSFLHVSKGEINPIH